MVEAAAMTAKIRFIVNSLVKIYVAKARLENFIGLNFGLSNNNLLLIPPRAATVVLYPI